MAWYDEQVKIYKPCPQCGRTHFRVEGVGILWCGAYATVEHGYFGCESGCCGHWIYVFYEHDNEVDRRFEFIHPDISNETKEEFCKRLVEHSFSGILVRYDESDIMDIGHY